MMKDAKKSSFPWTYHYPPDIAWDVEYVPSPLFDIFDQTVRRFPDNSCLHFLGKTFTYQDVNSLINQVARGFQDFGVGQGTRIGIFMPNTPYYVIFYYAILKVGGVVVNFNPLYVASEIRHQIEDSHCEIMVTLDLDFLFKKVHAHLQTSALRKIIVCPLKHVLPFPKNILFPLVKFKDLASIPKHENIIYYTDLIKNEGNPKIPVIDPLADTALIQYTGGTTGTPKGALLTHYNLYCNALQCEAWFSPLVTHGEEKILAVLPFFHVFAMTVVMNLSIRVGGEIVMMFPRFDIDEAMKLVQKHKITCLPAVPTIYTMINNHKNRHLFNLKSLKACISGGAALPVEVKNEFERLTGAKLIEGYGLTEASPVVCANPLRGANKAGSIGLPLPQSFIKIMSLDQPDVEVPLGQTGQIVVRGPQVMKGYWHQPHESSAVLKDGFLYTGDVGYMDEEGYTFLIDRLKDLIIVNGYNVYPRMIEEAIHRHAAVEEVSVVGIPDKSHGEVVKAFIKLRAGSHSTAEDIKTFLKGHLSPLEMPKQIEFRDALPKTMIGKLSKKELRVSHPHQDHKI
ncbi:MAG: long-chain-fatty-acid--CoA ligase [Janthinobacterium lividum]